MPKNSRLQRAIARRLNNRARRVAPVFGVSPLVIAVSGALAQDVGNDQARREDERLEEVEVTGQRPFRAKEASSATGFNLPLIETPQSITVITEDVIDIFRPEDRNNLDKYVAGLSNFSNEINSNDSSRGPALVSRGFRLDPDNGYRINGFAAANLFRPDFVAVERVEFVKGPTAIVYGVNDYGGVLNTVIKRPLNKPQHEIGVSFGDFDYSRIELDSTGPIGGSQNVQYRFMAAYEDQNTKRDGETATHYQIVPSLSWNLSASTEVNVIAFLHDEDVVPCGRGLSQTLDNDGELSFPYQSSRKTCLGLPEASLFEFNHQQIWAEVSHNFSNSVYLKGRLGWADNEFKGKTVYTFNYLGPAAPFTYVYNSRFPDSLESYDAELDFGGEFEAFGNDHKFLVKAEFRTLERFHPNYGYTYLGSTDMFDPDFSFLDGDDSALDLPVSGIRDENRKRAGLSAQVFFRATDRLSLLAGLRWTHMDFRIDEVHDFYGFSVDVDETQSKITPRLGLVYSISPDLTVFGSYAEGFIPQTGFTRDLEVIDPETGEQIEFGLKGEFFDNALGATLTYYSVDRDGVAAADPTNTLGESFVVKGRQQEHKGVELEVIGKVAQGLNIIGTYAYQDAVLTASVSNPAQVGTDVTFVPDYLWSLHLAYELQAGSMQGLSVAAGMTYSDEYYNRTSQPTLFPARRTVDFSAGYDAFKNLDLRLTINNITDERTFYTSFGCSLSCIWYQEPRTIRVHAGYSF